MEDVKVHLQLVSLWKFKNNQNSTGTAKKIYSFYGQSVIIDCQEESTSYLTDCKR